MVDHVIKKITQKRLLSGVFLLLIIFTLSERVVQDNDPAKGTSINSLFVEQAVKTWVEFEARVKRLLSDDDEGSRHQRFIVNTDGITVLIAHNIDLAPRVPVRPGDLIKVRGRYEWNAQGGVVHWTHHDPQNNMPGGWIQHHKKKYK
ncbi:DUF3465 domain-containing protein [Marinicella sediminis]|uniref:DUF3465 domain-containing protein n=1 Tax=Marinicella sediminis TaxID=1792834 RepID=A0ABV7JE29_9GAMM|nr:DUF3465 domain-containing protein [Marinicella sediminis]